MNNPITSRQSHILSEILEESLKSNPNLNPIQFRNKHSDYLNELDFIESREIAKINTSTSDYELTSIGLILCQSDKSTKLLESIDKICDTLRSLYKDSADQPINYSDFINNLDISEGLASQCLHYVTDIGVISITRGSDNKAINIIPRERLLRFTHFSEIPTSYLPSWFPDWEPKKKQKDKPHGNTESNASKREEILGAALAVMAALPEDCKTSTGSFRGSEIANLIDQKSFAIFDNEDGEPPLGKRQASELINKWLNISKKLK